MKGSDVDQYIVDFEELAFQAEMDLDEPTTMRMFSNGLPKILSDACLDYDNPETFEEWIRSAQNRQTIYLKKQAFRGNYNITQDRGQNRS